MTTTHTAADQKWLDELTVQLRVRQIKGSVIGDIIAQVETHLIDSEESAQVTFGDPATYAESLYFSPAQKHDRSPASWIRLLAPCLPGLIGLLLTGSFCHEIDSKHAVPISWGSIISLSVIIIAATLFMTLTKLILTKITASIIFGFTSLALCTLPIVLFPDTAFAIPFWTTAVVIGLLLSISVIGMHRIEDPVVDPRSPQNREPWAWTVEWIFVLLALIIYVVPAGVRLLLR